MKTTILFAPLLFVLLSSNTFAAANVRPECEAWVKELETIMAPQNNVSELNLQKDKTPKQLVEVIKKYPPALEYQLNTRGQNRYKDAVETAYAHPGCREMAYYDAVKRVIDSPKMSNTLKKDTIASLLKRIQSNDNIEPSLIAMILNLKLIEIAIESKLLKVSDSAYYQFGSIRKETNLLHSNVRFNEPNVFDCLEKKNCGNDDYKSMYSILTLEYDGAKALQHELAWWAKRQD